MNQLLPGFPRHISRQSVMCGFKNSCDTNSFHALKIIRMKTRHFDINFVTFQVAFLSTCSTCIENFLSLQTNSLSSYKNSSGRNGMWKKKYRRRYFIYIATRITRILANIVPSNFNFAINGSAKRPFPHRENRTSFNEPERNEFHRTLQNRVETGWK